MDFEAARKTTLSITSRRTEVSFSPIQGPETQWPLIDLEQGSMRGTDDQRVVDVQKSMGHPVETDTSVGTSVLIPVHRSIFLDDKYL